MTLLLHYTFKLDAPIDEAQSHDGTWSAGTEQYIVGIFDMILRAANFDGSSRITVPTETDFDFIRTDPFSVSFWIKTTNSTGTGMVVKMLGLSTQAGWGIGFQANPGELMFDIGNGSAQVRQFSGATKIDDGKWHHCVCTYDGTENRTGMNMYIDGVTIPQGSSLAITGDITNNASVMIGASSNGTNLLTGQMTEVRIYDIELTAAQAVRLFKEGTNRYGFTSWDGDVT